MALLLFCCWLCWFCWLLFAFVPGAGCCSSPVQFAPRSPDPHNTIFISTGHAPRWLEKWFGHLRVGLVAEFGFFYSPPPPFESTSVPVPASPKGSESVSYGSRARGSSTFSEGDMDMVRLTRVHLPRRQGRTDA